MTDILHVRVALRQLQVSDLELLFAWRQDARVMIYLRSQVFMPTWEVHWRWWQEFKGLRWVVTINDPKDPALLRERRVGVVQVKDDGEIGIVMGARDLLRSGIASKALAILMQLAPESPPLWAAIHPENEGSHHLFKKAGWRSTIQRERAGQMRWVRA